MAAQQGATKTFQFKLVLLGESAVGKSSLVLRFVKGQFHEYQESTIGGNEFVAKRMEKCLFIDSVHKIIYGVNFLHHMLVK